MKKDELALVFLIILLLCAAAVAAAAGALTGPSGRGGAVEAPFAAGEEKVSACFTDGDHYASLLAGKTRQDFDPAVIRFEGKALPYDSASNTLYIPQDIREGEWKGVLSASAPFSRICILDKESGDMEKCIEEGKILKIAAISDRNYMECGVIFTGLPTVSLTNGGRTPEPEEEYSGVFCVLDPAREQYQEADCSFHIRGATSTIFDKKSYRVELKKTDTESDKAGFLGLRRDDDWILNSLCTDRSLAREKVCYDLWKRLNEEEEDPVPSSQIEYCELFLNNEYMGVYGLMFPVDKKLMGMEAGDLLYKVEAWYEEMDVEGSLTDYNGKSEIRCKNGASYLSLKYPKEEGKACIYDPFALYQEMVFETGDPQALEQAGITLDLDNFILHELFCEMTRAGDNTWKNMFIAARSDGRGGYTFSETIWDLNYTFGDDFKWDPDHGNTVFRAETVDSYKLRYDRDYGYSTLVQAVEGLRKDTAEKWNTWRSAGIGPEYVSCLFDENRELLNRSGAFARNRERWSAPDEEIAYAGISDWISGRFQFLDEMYGYKE